MEGMGEGSDLGRVLMVAGGALFLLGAGSLVFARAGWRLPGDLVYQKGGFTIYFPVVTCLIVSILLTVLFSLLKR